jgi:VCBS repeat-containing protein
VAAVDPAGARVSDRFVLQLDNVNDAPLSGTQTTITATEGTRVMRGKLDAVDPDGDTLQFSLTAFQKRAPGFSFEPDGQWQFDPADPYWRNLKAGAKRQATMRFKATDPQGDSGTLSLVLEVTGVNNPPQVDALSEVKLSNIAPPMEGRIQATDVDEDARLSYEVLGDKRPEGFTLEADGRWRLDPAHESYRALGPNEFRSFFVPIKVADEAGGITIARLQITVTGTQP